jgi:hypothetical protein
MRQVRIRLEPLFDAAPTARRLTPEQHKKLGDLILGVLRYGNESGYRSGQDDTQKLITFPYLAYRIRDDLVSGALAVFISYPVNRSIDRGYAPYSSAVSGNVFMSQSAIQVQTTLQTSPTLRIRPRLARIRIGTPEPPFHQSSGRHSQTTAQRFV